MNENTLQLRHRLIPDVTGWAIVWIARPLYALIEAPSYLFLATLAVMLFRPPDVQFYSLDRIALGILMFALFLRKLALHQAWTIGPVSVPLFALLILAFCSVLNQPYEAQTWSLFAAKWLVPFTLYHLAGQVFSAPQPIRRLEGFFLIILAYLCLTASFFLVDARSLIFPRYILDQSIGIHADRARGPFLQAVANGVSLNVLGLIAMDAYRRKQLRGFVAFLFMAIIPLAILATRTRAVWASFAGSVLLLPFCYPHQRVKRACLFLFIGAGIGTATFLLVANSKTSLSERLQEKGPVEFRMGMYAAGLEMFIDKPLLGWKADAIQSELGRRISDFHPTYFLFHNTYLEVAVSHGLLGLSLYTWVIVDLFRLTGKGRNFIPSAQNSFLDADFRKLWPLILIVYMFNAFFVVMSYQFVNGLLFTIAGMLAGQNRRSELS